MDPPMDNPRLERIHDLRKAVDDAAVLLSLHEVGVLSRLAEGPATVAELVETLGLSGRRLRAFLEVMAALGFLLRTGEEYRLHPGDEALFGSEEAAHLALPGKSVEAFFASRSRFPGLLKGAPHEVVAGSGGEVDVAAREAFLRYLDGLSREGAAELAALVPQENPQLILDLGGGAGTYSHALLQRFESAHAVLVDRPNAEALVALLAEERGVGDRLSFSGLDFMEEDLPELADVVIVSNIAHIYGVEANRALIRRAAKALAPGGVLVVKDLEIRDDRSGPIAALRFAVYMVVATEEGNVYSPETVGRWCADVGLEVEEVHSLTVAEGSYAVVARRPRN